MLDKKEVYFCQSCQNSVQKDKYCPDCGAHNLGKTSTLKTIFTNAFSEVFSFEKGLFHNFKITFSKPHDIVWSYFNGIRNKYAAPGKFLLYTLFILGAIYLIGPPFEVLSIDINGESTNALTGTKIFLILIIPFLSLSSKIVFWKNKGLALHAISMIYLFLPRFVIVSLIILVINLSYGQHWSQQLLLLIMIFNTLWTNVTVQKKDSSMLEKAGFTALQFKVLILLIAVIIIGLVLTGVFNLDFQEPYN